MTNSVRISLPADVQALCDEINGYKQAVGRAVVVGGAVRDAMMGKPLPKDIDIEVFGVEAVPLEKILANHGEVRKVGKQFGIFKVKLFESGDTVDVSLPRRESKIGVGHKGFLVEVDHNIYPYTASLRRDFTINAIMYQTNPQTIGRTSGILDFHKGMMHIEERILMHVSDAFGEDPLRVLRGMRFAGQFDMRMDSGTSALCAGLIGEYESISKERIWEEWKGMLGKSERPSAAIRVLVETGWIAKYPEIANLADTEQDKDWHPEGNAFVHTMYVMDAAAEIARRENLEQDERVILLLSALCHDMGKAGTEFDGTPITQVEDGHITSKRHASAGVPIAREFMRRIGTPDSIATIVSNLVLEHMFGVGGDKPSRASVLRLARRLHPASIEQLERVMEADHSGRPPKPASRPGLPLVEMAREIDCEKKPVEPLLMGRDLLQRGVKPGKHIGEILRRADELQEESILRTKEDALIWLDGELMRQNAVEVMA